MKQIDQNPTGTEAVKTISNMDIYIQLQNVLNNKIY